MQNPAKLWNSYLGLNDLILTKNVMAMVTVIIPALNEGDTLGTVISLVKKSPLVSEVIVMDDKSEDITVTVAREAGATVGV